MMKRSMTLLLLLLFSLSPAFAQLQLQGELRPRTEYRSGYKKILTENQEDAFFISQRSRLNLYYTLSRVKFGISIQDTRVWGDEGLISSSGIFGDKASLDLNEAWVGISLYKKGSLKIGRQYWAYEDERLLSKRGWNQNQVKYDAITFSHQAKQFQLDLGLSWNNSKENIFGNEYPKDRMKTMNFIYLSGHVTPWLSMSGLAALSGFTRTDSTSDLNLLATLFGYIIIDKDNLEAVLSGSYQYGDSRTGKETRAYMFSAKGNYTVERLTFGTGIDYLSGNNASRNDISYQEIDHSYDILYGARHRYYGHMDFFSSMQKATQSGGLADVFLKLTWQFIPAACLNGDIHYFSLQNYVRDETYTGNDIQYYKRGLGPEVDINISWDILEILNLKGGYSIMFPSETMNKIQQVDASSSKHPQWFWLMLTAKPTFLSISK